MRWQAFGVAAVIAMTGCGGATPDATQAEAEGKRQIAEAEAALAEAEAEGKRQIAEAEAEGKRQIAEAEAEGKRQIAEAEAALAAAEKEARVLAAEAAAAEAEAARLASEWAKSRVAAEAAVRSATAAVERAESALASCTDRASVAESRRQSAMEACRPRAGATYRQCEDDCTEAASRCRYANARRPNAREACDDSQSSCNGRCESVAERVCAAYAPSGRDLCRSEEGILEKAKPALESARAPVAESEGRARSASDLAESARRKADSHVTEPKAHLEEVRRATDSRLVEVRSATDSRLDDLKRGIATYLPGGTFVLGGTKQTVTVAPFSLDLTEVTIDAYAKCVSAGKCSAPNTGGTCNWNVGGKGNHPINCVDWNQATSYCQWAGKRLPTEPEWEWAARGQARGTEYPWGNDAPVAQACWKRSEGTCAVGGYPSGDAPGGIHDLAGNVREWTSTAYDDSARVDRGGGWDFGIPSRLRAAARNRSDPSRRYGNLGFRCAR